MDDPTGLELTYEATFAAGTPPTGTPPSSPPATRGRGVIVESINCGEYKIKRLDDAGKVVEEWMAKTDEEMHRIVDRISAEIMDRKTD